MKEDKKFVIKQLLLTVNQKEKNQKEKSQTEIQKSQKENQERLKESQESHYKSFIIFSKLYKSLEKIKYIYINYILLHEEHPVYFSIFFAP